MKCICCKFDNCRKEFERHMSNTTFFALDRQFTIIADLIEAEAEGHEYVDKVCQTHRNKIKTWLENVFSFYDAIKGGVMLTKIGAIK